MVDIEALEHERERIYNENKKYQGQLSDRSALKRKILTEDILRDDKSVRFYTGLPDLAHFNVVFDAIAPSAQGMKYWDKQKSDTSHYQKDETKRKPGRKRIQSAWLCTSPYRSFFREPYAIVDPVHVHRGKVYSLRDLKRLQISFQVLIMAVGFTEKKVAYIWECHFRHTGKVMSPS